MPSSNYTQTSFLGGEISPWAQGRVDQPTYRQSLKLCLNGLPVEEGAWLKRPGFVNLGYTHRSRTAIVRSFMAGGKFGPDPANTGLGFYYTVEISVDNDAAGAVRIWVPQLDGYPALLCDDAGVSITSFSGATPTVMTVGSAQTWVTGDTIIIEVTGGIATNGATVTGRQFAITKLTTTTFQLHNTAENAPDQDIVGSLITYTGGGIAKKITVFPVTTIPDIGYLNTVQTLQSGSYMLIFAWFMAPLLLTITDADPPVVTLADADFKEADGPYNDPLPGTSQTKNKTATATTSDGITYHITTGSDGPTYNFVSTDVGRCFRIWTQPAAWAAGTYTTGNTVTYNGNFWTCQAAGTTATPGQPQAVGGVQTFPWLLTPGIGKWTSTYITGFTDANEIDVHISFNETTSPLTRLTIDAWQIGLFTPGLELGNASCGGWFGGRLYLGGTPKRWDAGKPNGFEAFIARTGTLFSPTEPDGSVFDDSAIAETFNAKDRDEAMWFEPDEKGLIMGTANGEWLISSGAGDDIITPTSVKTRQVTRWKSAFIAPVRIGSVIVFVQAFGRKIYEYLVDAFSSRFTGRPLNANAQHLADQNLGIQELAYQEDPVPVVWATTGYIDRDTGFRQPGGALLGCTYRRLSDFATVDPVFQGWHQHVHGNPDRKFYSVAMTSVVNGQDTPILTTYDSASPTAFRVEVLSRIWGPA